MLSCLGLSTVFVSSLYVVDAGLSRNHPETVRRRLAVVAVVCLLAPLYLWLCSDVANHDSVHLLKVLGIRSAGLLPAVLVPILLVTILYIGPIFQSLSEGDALFDHVTNERLDLNFRTYIFAPFAEEFVFRACMLPLLVPWLGHSWSIIVCPLFFGLAHLHHIIDWYRRGDGTPFSHALLVVLVQFCYTSLFGMFSGFLFIRTGHLVSPIISHSLCNALGLPAFESISSHSHKATVAVAYVLGLLFFLILLNPLTTPHLFS